MSTSGRRKGAQFVSSPSDSSLATNFIDKRSPRDERSLPITHKRVISEKNAPLPEGHNTMAIFDSNGGKITVPLESSAVLEDGKVDFRKFVEKKEFNQNSKGDKVESKESARKEKNLVESKISTITEEPSKKKVTKHSCKYRPLGLSTKRKTDSQVGLKTAKIGSKTAIPKGSERTARNVSTQTTEYSLPIEPVRKLSGVQRSSERIYYPDGSVSLGQGVSPQTIRTILAGDGRDVSRNRGNSGSISSKNPCGDQISNKEFMRGHVKLNSAKHKSETPVPLHMRETINVRNLMKSRAPQRYSLIEPMHCDIGENSSTIYKEFSKINKNGILRRTLTMVLFTVVLSWFLSAIFRINIPGDLFRIAVNYLSTLPIFVKRRKRELTKAEIVFKYIGSFLRLVANIFGDPN